MGILQISDNATYNYNQHKMEASSVSVPVDQNNFDENLAIIEVRATNAEQNNLEKTSPEEETEKNIDRIESASTTVTDVNVDLLVEDSLEMNEPQLKECSLAEEADGTTVVKDPLSLSMFESNPNESSWRKEPEENSSDDEFDQENTSDSEEEENAREYFRMMQMRQMQALKVKGPNGEVKITHLPTSIKVTRVPESKEARLRRELELARRKEQAMKLDLEPCAMIGEKRKHGERMTLEDAKREDFEEAQDYVDFLQSKLKNISIKQCR